ncbi:type 1 fimbrial protein [Pseudomonas sp. LB3P81]
MKIMHLSAAMSLCFTLNSACHAAPPMAQGTIRFQGAIVERGCSAAMGKPSTLMLNACPTPAGTPTVNVHGIDPISARANLKLVSDSGREARYYDQQFEIVDSSGAPVRSGNYLITMTLP